ncbi:rhodanese-like domain-containing protein [Candidatus Parcubacteria bacterium]|nr:MAG: rhodanese-like domain-containing protein [Candidatus Parcubacteria bacterium]
MQTVSPQRLKNELEKGTSVIIVDLQENHEYTHSHIPGAINIPWSTFSQSHTDSLNDKDAIIVVYGEFDESGKGLSAAQILEKEGYNRVGYLEGGLMGWKDAGFPTENGSES